MDELRDWQHSSADRRWTRTPTAGLTTDQEQLLTFVTSYLRQYGCLPTATEAATGCGFRSPRPAARMLDELESVGIIQRDERYRRLGSVDASVFDDTTLGAADQLWVAERSLLEQRFLLTSLRAGLAHAPDLESVDAIHGEGLLRSSVVRSADDACRRLRDGGAELTPDDVDALAYQRDVLRRAQALMCDWDTYCIVQLVWCLSAREWLLEVPPLPLGYAGSSGLASLRAVESLLSTYRARTRSTFDAGGRIQHLLGELAELLGRLRRGLARHVPAPIHRQRVDVARLLTSP